MGSEKSSEGGSIVKAAGGESDSVLEKRLGDLTSSHPIPAHAGRAWVKMDLAIIPIVGMFYFLSFLVSSMPVEPLGEREMCYLRPWDAIS